MSKVKSKMVLLFLEKNLIAQKINNFCNSANFFNSDFYSYNFSLSSFYVIEILFEREQVKVKNLRLTKLKFVPIYKYSDSPQT